MSRLGTSVSRRAALALAVLCVGWSVGGAARGEVSPEVEEARAFQKQVQDLEAQRAAAHDELSRKGGRPEQHKALDDDFLNRARQLESTRTEQLKKLGQKAGVGEGALKQGAYGTQPTEGRGAIGDVDSASLSGKDFDKVKQTAKKAGYTVVEQGDTFTIKELDTTVHRGESPYKSQAGSSARQTEAARGYGRETSRSLGTGDANVKVMDNLGKSGHTLDKPAGQMRASDWQEMGKMTGRNMDAAGITDPKLREQCEMLKKGYHPKSVGIDDMGDFQRKCQQANAEAAKQTRAQAKAVETQLEGEVRKAATELDQAKKSGDPRKINEAAQKQKTLREQLSEHRTSQKAAEEALTKNQPQQGKKILEQTKPTEADIADAGKKLEAKAKTATADADGPGGQKKAVTTADADGPGGPKKGTTTTDPDGPGAKGTTKPTVDADGPGGQKKGATTADADGPGGRKATGKGATDVDGPGGTAGKGDAPPSKLGQAGKVIGEYMEGAAILNQAGKIREGIKEGDATKVAAGVAGEDTAQRTKMEGAKGYADDLGDLELAKGAEAEAAMVGKLKRMGATPQEIDEFRRNYDDDPAKARQIAQGVRDRGGRDTKPQSGLEGAGPMESGWDAKEQLKEGAKQAGSYGKTILDGVSLGGVSRGEQSEADLGDIVGQATHVEKATAERVIGALYTSLRENGATPEEARAALKDYFKDPKDVRELAAELKERDPERVGKAGGKREGLSVDNVDPEEDKDGALSRVTETLVNTAKGLKEELIDKPGAFISETAEDVIEVAVGSEKYEQERYADAMNKQAREQYQAKYDGLIKLGATPEEAKAALDGKAGKVAPLVKELHQRREQAEKERVAAETAEKQKLAKEKADKEFIKQVKDLFKPKDPVTSGEQDLAKAGEEAGGTGAGEPRDDAPRNDGGQMVDAGAYEAGDKIITSDGTEYEKKDGGWVKTGENYGPYDPKGALDKSEGGEWAEVGDLTKSRPGGGLEGYTRTTSERGEQEGKDSYTQMGLNQAVKEATTSGDKTAAEAQQVVDKGGRDAQETAGKTSAEIAKADRENSWGKAIGDAVQQGVEAGAKAAGEAFGTAAADRATKEIFEGGRRKGTATSDTGDDGQDPDGKVVAGGKPTPPVTVAGGKPTPRDKEVAGVGKKTPPVSGGSAGGAQKTSNTSGGSGGKTSTTDRGAYVYLVDCRKCGYREGPVKMASSSSVPSSKPCSRCGSTDIQEWAGYESLIPRPPAVSTSTNAVPETAAGTTPPAAPVPPAPPPAPEKKQRCPRCKSPDIYHSHDHYMYGAVYKCRACDNSFRSVYIVYE